MQTDLRECVIECERNGSCGYAPTGHVRGDPIAHPGGPQSAAHHISDGDLPAVLPVEFDHQGKDPALARFGAKVSAQGRPDGDVGFAGK